MQRLPLVLMCDSDGSDKDIFMIESTKQFHSFRGEQSLYYIRTSIAYGGQRKLEQNKQSICQFENSLIQSIDPKIILITVTNIHPGKISIRLNII